jgi:hypothetical protein
MGLDDRADDPGGAGHVLKLRRVPRFEGRYDDEQPGSAPTVVDGTLALAFPPRTTSVVPLRLVPPAGGAELGAPPPASPVASARRIAGPMAQAVAEVLAGVRSPQQLTPIATFPVLKYLERNAGRMASRAGRTPVRPRVSSIRVCEPAAGIAEIAAVVDTSPRRRALALRLEASGERWLCTVVRAG